MSRVGKGACALLGIGCFCRLLLCHGFSYVGVSLSSPRLVPSSSMWDFQPVQPLLSDGFCPYLLTEGARGNENT